jgi:hydroxypyruvate reductase
MNAALEAVRRSLAHLEPSRLVRRAMRSLPFEGPFALVAFGKAAAAMTEGVLAARPDALAEGLVVIPEGTAPPSRHRALRVAEAPHPLPDARSVRAARRAAKVMASGWPVLALVSGGGSSLVAWPVPGLTIAKKSRLVADLLASGAPIHEVNLVRRHLSRVKGGGLLRLAWPRPVCSLIVSDVVSGRPEDVASGPTVPSSDRLRDARAVARKWLGARADGLPLRACLAPDSPRAALASMVELASPERLARRVATELRARGLVASVGRLGSPSLEPVVQDLLGEAGRLGPRSARIFPVETTIALPKGTSGRGGRASHLALRLAGDLPPGVSALVVATDGVDGASGHAGGLVDHRTFRGRRAEVLAALRVFDSGALLRRCGAHVELPRGHNLTDLVVLSRA